MGKKRTSKLSWKKEGKIMTKADLVETIYEKIGFSRKESAEIVDLVFDS